MLKPDEIREFEPYANGICVPNTGIVDYASVAKKYAELICQSWRRQSARAREEFI
jgi:L-2-hydroxyglutarate oxidase